jgi:hypothetical protein
MTARAAANAIVSLASVDEIHVSLAARMTDSRPTTAESGYPLASAFPNTARSGATSTSSW